MDVSKFTGKEYQAIAANLGITATFVEYLLTLATTKKLQKAETKFKQSVPSFKKKGKREFTFVREEKGSFFFVDMRMPLMKKDIPKHVAEYKKKAANAKEGEKETMEATLAFFEALEKRIKTNKFVATYGTMRKVKDEDGNAYMAVNKAFGVDKADLHNQINELGFAAKDGSTLKFMDPKDAPPMEDEDETTDTTGETTTDEGTETTETTETTEDTTQDTTQGETAPQDGSAPDGKTIAAEFSKIDAAAKNIAKLQGAEQVKLVLAVYKNIQAFKPKLEAYISEASAKDKEKAEKMLAKINQIYTKIEPIASQVDQKQSEKSTTQMEGIFGEIGAAINEILASGEDLDSISPDLKTIMESIKK